MQNQPITGYRKLTAQEIELINEIKDQANNLGAAVEMIGQMPDVDKRALAIAKTELQTGFMWLTRAIARPAGF